MILLESDLEHRVIRKDKHGNRWEYSDKKDKPTGNGWERVNADEHPRASVYLWVRSYSHVAEEMRQETRKPVIDKPTDLVSIDPRLMPSLDIEVGNVLNDFRNQLRKQFDYEKNPFMAGDRVRIAGKDGVFYVRGVDPVRKRLVAVNAANNEDVQSVGHDDAKLDNERGPMPWYFGDTVKIAAGALDKKETEGQVIGYDNHSNKVRVQMGTESYEVYPEAIIGLRGKNNEILKSAKDFLDKNPNSFASPDSKKIMESLLRASLEGRSQVKVNEIMDDVRSTSGIQLTPGSVRGTFMALSSLFRGGAEQSMFYNPVLDNLHIAEGALPIRLVCKSRDIKNTHKSFGWKNITKENTQETYAHVGQRVLLPEGMTDENGNAIREGKIRKIMGNKVEVAYKGVTRVMYMGDVKDIGNRTILPDPTDPAAFGSVNKNAFWLMRDREWCRDYKPGDIVSMMQTLQDPSGNKARIGDFGKVIDTTTDGRLIVMTNSGTKISVSPRQVRQNRKVADIKQMADKVQHDPSSVYGTMTVVGTNPNEQVRIGVGDERKNKFMEFRFDNGNAYHALETSLFEAVVDDKATQGQRRAILPLNPETAERERKTLVPNKSLVDMIRKLYPTAKTFMITREMKRFQQTPTASVRPQASSPGALDKALTKGLDPNAPDLLDVQPSSRKFTKQYKDYYEPKDLDSPGVIYDEDKGEFHAAPRVGTEPVGKWSFLNPFGSKTPANTLTFSPGEMDHMQAHSPVVMRVVINPNPKDSQGRVGVIHDIPSVIRQFSEWKDPTKRPKGVMNTEDLDWDNRIKITTDGTNLFVEVGKNVAANTSADFPGPDGKPSTFDALVKMSMAHKYAAWQQKYPKDKFADMLLHSSLLTYDHATRRYQTRLSHYDEVHSFLKRFYGDSYQNITFEDVDGAHCFNAEERKLSDAATKYKHTTKLSTDLTSEEIPPQLHDGFAIKNMGYNGKDATPEDLANWEERDYQRETLNFLLNNPKTLLANDQGTGKSGCILGAIMGRVNQKQVKRTLIVAPANLVGSSWPDEIEFWCKDQKALDQIRKNKHLDEKGRKDALRNIPTSIDYALLTTKTKDDFYQKMLTQKDPIIGVTSFEMAVLHAKELQRLGFDMVVLDEAQNIKSGETDKREGSLRSQVIKDMFVDTPYKIAATGTPVENSAEDLHSIVSWLDPDLLGPAPQFMQDFVETDYVDTPDGKKPVNVAIKNPWDLKARLDGVFKRYSKDYLRQREQAKIKSKMEANGETFNEYLHYGSIAPRLVYPLVSLNPDGSLVYKQAQRPSESYMDPDLARPIDLANPKDVDPKKYAKYLNAVRTANQQIAQEYAGFSSMKTKYGGTVNTKASSLLMKMQQVLNDPYSLSKDEAFRENPLFNDPNIPNPKYDRLLSILGEHDRKPLNINHHDLEYNPLQGTKKQKNREVALNTRGKTIIFCQTVEAMKSLQRRLESDPRYRGRSMFYAGTGSIGQLAGKSGNAKQIQRDTYNKFKTDEHADILIANVAAQTGLSIPQADLVVNYEMPWNPQAMNQQIDRAHRMGRGASNQHRPVTAINLYTARTVEEKKIRAHAFRNQLFDALINTEEKSLNAGRERAKQRLVDIATTAGSERAAALHGEDRAAIMEDIIRDNPELHHITAMSENNIVRAQLARRAAAKQLELKNKSLKVPPRKTGLVSKLFGWV